MNRQLRKSLMNGSADLSAVASFIKAKKDKHFDQSMNPYHVSKRVWGHLFSAELGQFKQDLTLEDIQKTVLKLGGRVNQELVYYTDTLGTPSPLHMHFSSFPDYIHSSFPLHMLLRQRPQGFKKMVQFLLAHGADPNLKDSELGGAIMYVDPVKDASLLKLLLKYKAKPETADNYGEGYALYFYYEYFALFKNKTISRQGFNNAFDQLFPLMTKHKEYWVKDTVLRMLLRRYMLDAKNFQTKQRALQKLHNSSLQRQTRAIKIKSFWRSFGYEVGITAMKFLKEFDGRD